MSLNRTKFLEPKELSNLKETLKLDSRDNTLITLAVETGARAGEILSLKFSDLFKDTCTVFFRTSKGGRDREIPVRPELMEALLKYVPFNIKYRRFHQIWQRYRPANKKLHSLRHTFAVNLYLKTKDLKLTQLALGHSSPVTTSIYTDFVYSRDEMRKILD